MNAESEWETAKGEEGTITGEIQKGLKALTGGTQEDPKRATGLGGSAVTAAEQLTQLQSLPNQCRRLDNISFLIPPLRLEIPSGLFECPTTLPLIVIK